MALIKSISGIRGTIGGVPGSNLTPLDIVKFTIAYSAWVATNGEDNKNIVVGRDGRISGKMVIDLVIATLMGRGYNVYDLDLSTTPTVEMAVTKLNAAGGIIVTASHNPKEWNALKLLNAKGEFVSAEAGKWILDYAERTDFTFADVNNLGKRLSAPDALKKHCEAIMNYPHLNKEAIKGRDFKIVADVINSTGAIAVPEILAHLGVKHENIILINSELTGNFAHNPEPLPEHLIDLCQKVKEHKADLGIAVDPDVDRLCFVCEDGTLFGEEYTLVAIADYILAKTKGGNTVSNMSSTRALRDITQKHGGIYSPTAVGEVNVVNKMKAVNAVIGGEGNGGVIVPELHYGRDALAGIAIFLSYMAESGKTASAIRAALPNYYMSKNKIALTEGIDVPGILKAVQAQYASYPTNTEDGLKIDFEQGWVHLRTSNTEPIIRVYAEADTESNANAFATQIMKLIEGMMG